MTSKSPKRDLYWKNPTNTPHGTSENYKTKAHSINIPKMAPTPTYSTTQQNLESNKEYEKKYW